MPITYLDTSLTTSGVNLTLTTGMNVVVEANTRRISTGSVAFDGGLMAGGSVTVFGSVIAESNAISIGGIAGSNSIFVEESGTLMSTSANTVLLDGSTTRLSNEGLISTLGFGPAAVGMSGDVSSLFNAGTIRAEVFTVTYAAAGLSSVNTLINTGSIIAMNAAPGTVALNMSNGVDTVANSGLIIGNVSLASGADSFDGTGGTVRGVILGGAGNDTIIGGIGADRMDGGADNDTLFFDAEDQTFGSVTGGTGYDTGTNIGGTMTLNMTATSLEAFFGSAADEVIIAGTLGGFGAFVRAGDGNDLFDGSAQADNVDGGNGVDVLYGRGGADILAGGLGGDWLQGGAGADVFDYNAGTDSTVNGQDFIADFSTAEGDKINLDDALTNLGFATATFNTGFGTNASVYVFAQGGTSLVQVYTGATLQMQLVVSQASLAVSDFVL